MTVPEVIVPVFRLPIPIPISDLEDAGAQDPVEAYGLAVAALGETSAEALASWIAQQFGLHLEPRFFPLYRESFRQLTASRARKTTSEAQTLGSSASN